jgi:hypothetical protein
MLMSINVILSPIQTLTVGSRISLDQPLTNVSRSQAHITAGWEFHPAPKEFYMKLLKVN